MLEPGFLEHVQAMALRFKQQLARLKDDYPHVIEEVRGSGLLIGLKVKLPNGEVVNACADEKLLTVGAGDNVVRLLAAAQCHRGRDWRGDAAACAQALAARCPSRPESSAERLARHHGSAAFPRSRPHRRRAPCGASSTWHTP